MASISADTFEVREHALLPHRFEVRDNCRKHRVRKWFYYPPSSMTGDIPLLAKEVATDKFVGAPLKMALAAWHAHRLWQEYQR